MPSCEASDDDLREWEKPLSPEKLAWLIEQFRILDARFNARGQRRWNQFDWPHAAARARRGW